MRERVETTSATSALRWDNQFHLPSTALGIGIDPSLRKRVLSNRTSTYASDDDSSGTDSDESFYVAEPDWSQVTNDRPICRQDVIDRFENGLRMYRACNWFSAIEEFDKVLQMTDGVDPPSTLFINRCKEFMRVPPPNGTDWDGVYRPKSK